MPIELPVSAPVIVVRGGQATSSNNEGTSGGGGVPVAPFTPRQVAGLVPLTPCDEVPCRTLPDVACCERLTVFGNIGDNKSTYENDISNFLIDVGLYRANVGGVTVAWTLERGTSGFGVDCEYGSTYALNNTDYGTPLPFGTYSTHQSYNGYIIDWGKVLNVRGAGTYRVRVTITYGDVEFCFLSPPFWLREFDCKLADGTVKFETSLTGKIGSIKEQGYIFDLCNMTHRDSIRVRGFFGYETVPEYLQLLNEFQNGNIQQIRNEAVQQFRYLSHYMPKEYHDRFKVYGMMADELRVSDYNRNNSDYNISQLKISPASGYEPTYQDMNRRRISKVEVTFKAGVQNVIKSLCCSIK